MNIKDIEPKAAEPADLVKLKVFAVKDTVETIVK